MFFLEKLLKYAKQSQNDILKIMLTPKSNSEINEWTEINVVVGTTA
jgi:hypothetical protein